MSGARDDGGPAFPYLTASESRNEVTTHEGEHGMSLRDYFAAKVFPQACEVHAQGHADGWLGVARTAYAIADAMLKARSA